LFVAMSWARSRAMATSVPSSCSDARPLAPRCWLCCANICDSRPVRLAAGGRGAVVGVGGRITTVGVGGAGVGGIEVAVGGTGVGGIAVGVGGASVAVGGTGVGGTSVAVGGIDVAVGPRAVSPAASAAGVTVEDGATVGDFSAAFNVPGREVAVGSRTDRGAENVACVFVAVAVGVFVAVAVATLAAKSTFCADPPLNMLSVKAATTAIAPRATMPMPMRCRSNSGLLTCTLRKTFRPKTALPCGGCRADS